MRFRLSRRKLLLGSAALTAAAGASYWIGSANRAQEPKQTIAAVIDTILPRDDFPGGLDLGLDLKLEKSIQEQPEVGDFMNRVVAAIEQKSIATYKQEFIRLDIDQREALLTELISPDAPQRARIDLRRLRARLLTDYYSSIEGQKSLGYQIPALYPAYRQS